MVDKLLQQLHWDVLVIIVFLIYQTQLGLARVAVISSFSGDVGLNEGRRGIDQGASGDSAASRIAESDLVNMLRQLEQKADEIRQLHSTANQNHNPTPMNAWRLRGVPQTPHPHDGVHFPTNPTKTSLWESDEERPKEPSRSTAVLLRAVFADIKPGRIFKMQGSPLLSLTP